jgi:CBS domain-containing protein
MRVADLMSRHVEFIEADAPVQEAAVLMGELDVGALPVGAPERLEGVLTDRDILYRVVARGGDCAAVRVRDVLTTPVLSCRPEDEVRHAMDLMAAHHIRRLPVRDGAGRVVGWMTLADLSRRLLLDSGALQAALRDATEGGAAGEPATADSAGRG